MTHHLVQAEGNLLQIQFAGLDLAEVQDVVEDPQQVGGGAADLAQVVLLLGRELGAQGQRGQADDGVHRRADLVAHVGQEAAPRIGCGLRGVTGILELVLELDLLSDVPHDRLDAAQLGIGIGVQVA